MGVRGLGDPLRCTVRLPTLFLRFIPSWPLLGGAGLGRSAALSHPLVEYTSTSLMLFLAVHPALRFSLSVLSRRRGAFLRLAMGKKMLLLEGAGFWWDEVCRVLVLGFGGGAV